MWTSDLWLWPSSQTLAWNKITETDTENKSNKMGGRLNVMPFYRIFTKKTQGNII